MTNTNTLGSESETGNGGLGAFRLGSSDDSGHQPPAPPNRWQIPPIDSRQRMLGGAAAALSRELGVETIAVRAAFVILALSGGWGLLFYGLAWSAMYRSGTNPATYNPQPKAESASHRYLALMAIVTGVTLFLRALGFGFIDWVVFPAGFVLVGALIAWSRGQEEGGVPTTLRILAGVVVATGGLVAIALINFPTTQTLLVLGVATALIAGLGLIVGPSLIRIGSELDDERQQRIRSDERARVAAHLHDSVLQTLMLIQKHSDDPDRTARIARQQERDLRSWLYDPKATVPGSVRLGPALEQAASRVEQNHGVRIEVITVGDNQDLATTTVEAVAAAAAEAMTNAAKHSGVDSIDVFAERTAKTIEVFVRDDGTGFDVNDIADDRMGIRESIVGRLERLGGTVTIESQSGNGTEVELIVPHTGSDTEPSTESTAGSNAESDSDLEVDGITVDTIKMKTEGMETQS